MWPMLSSYNPVQASAALSSSSSKSLQPIKTGAKGQAPFIFRACLATVAFETKVDMNGRLQQIKLYGLAILKSTCRTPTTVETEIRKKACHLDGAFDTDKDSRGKCSMKLQQQV